MEIRIVNLVNSADFHIEGMNDRVYMMKSFVGLNSVDGVHGSQENSQPVPKRKMKVYLRMDVEIK